MSHSGRLDRLERLVRPVPTTEVMSPERREALMRKLEAVGLAEWREGWQQWHPTDPRLLKQLLRERAGRDR